MPLASSVADITPSSHEKQTEQALRALKGRPKFSIAMQVYLAVLISLVIFFGIAMSLLVTTYMIEQKVHFLEISNNYLFEIQQARRFEKNYFLYGTNLDDALENVETAKRVLFENAEGLEEVMGKATFSLLLPRLDDYQHALEQLKEIESNPSAPDYQEKKRDSEATVRELGQHASSLAQDLMQKEKTALDKMIVLSRRVHVFSFLFLFLFFAFNTYFLGRRVLRPLKRFLAYAERIASGDYSPITPVRRYRDEFSDLSVAINKMILEIEIKQDQLIQSHKVAAIGLLTSGVAHELNNPINNINITAEYIIENYAEMSDQEKKSLLSDIMQQGRRASSTVRELLHFTRARTDAFEPLSVVSVIEDTLKLLQNQLTLNKIVVKKDYPDVIPRVKGNRNNLQQVFLNLFLNAVQAMPRGGTLCTKVKDIKEGLLEVDVIDDGVGIPAEYLQKVFDPYFTTKEIGEGTGLGLAVCFGIVSKHGGRIMVDSEPGKGSTFHVFLPCIEEKVSQARPSVDQSGQAAAFS